MFAGHVGMNYFALSRSLGGDSELCLGFLLLFSERTEECNLLRARRLPLIVRLKGALEVRLDVHIEGLGL